MVGEKGLGVRFGEVALQRGVILPLLQEQVVTGLLEVGVHPVAAAVLLLARAAAHPGG
jgi:hypothetical protein